MTNAFFNSIAKIAADTFKCNPDDISSCTVASDIEKWDSLSNIKLLLKIEKQFGVKFNGVEAASLDTFGDLVDLVAKKIS